MLDQKEMAQSVSRTERPPVRLRAAWERRLLVAWYSFLGWAFAPGWVSALFQAISSIGLLVLPLWKIGWKYGFFATCIWGFNAVLKVRRELAPRHMQRLQEQRAERQLRLLRLVEKLQQSLATRETLSTDRVQEYQVEVLQLIASYMRTHRSDLKGTIIYANLLTEQDGTLTVLARDQRHRMDSIPVPKEHSLAWQALLTGEAKLTGNVYADWPETPSNRPYRSILAIPVFRTQKVVGVVTIDSSRRYHFDSDFANIVLDLSAFVALLAWTLDNPQIIGQPRGGSADN